MTKNHDIIWLDTVKSTNEYVKLHIPVLKNMSVVAAEVQTAGKGQGDHTWLSEPGKNLTFSMVLKEEMLADIPPKSQFIISAVTAISIVKLLERHGIEARIKWPNDIYACDRKICGILIENSIKGQRFTWSIIGIGLNVNQRTFDPSLPNPTSMFLCNGKREIPSLSVLLEEFINIFTANFDIYTKNGDREDFRIKYLSYIWSGSDENLVRLSLSSLQ